MTDDASPRLTDEQLEHLLLCHSSYEPNDWGALTAAETLAVLTELQSLRAAVKRVEELHPQARPMDVGLVSMGARRACGTCETWWPCPTIRALRGEE